MVALSRAEPPSLPDPLDGPSGVQHTHPLLRWIVAADPTRGVRTLDGDRSWQFHSYESLADQTLAVAERLRDDGVRQGDVVTVVLKSGIDFIASFFGVLVAGATASPVAPPMVFQDPVGYDYHLRRVLEVARPRTVVTSPELVPRLEQHAGLVPSTTILTGDAAPRPANPAMLEHRVDRAILQFTSGSAGVPKGVAISGDALAANVEAIRRWLKMTKDDPTATWLPVYHDMGLIGCLITPIVNGSDLWMMQPEDFVRAPARWLSCFGEHGARLTALPNFGLEHVVRRVRPEALEDFDFSEWRVAILGAERIQLSAMRAFYDLLRGHGFRWETFLPAYGLAEATLAVTGLPVRRGARSAHIESGSLRVGEPVAVLSSSEPETSSVSLVGCGPPLEEKAVRILDANGVELGAQMLGEVVVTSPSLADGYCDERGIIVSAAFADGCFRTGDAGFIVDDELFIVGRLGDSLKVRGRTLFAEDLEDLAVGVAGLRPGRLVVLVGSLDGEDSVVAIAEARPGPWVEPTVAALGRHTEGLDTIVAVGPRGCLLRTSSGKPRRRLIWDAFANGGLGVEVICDTRTAGLDSVPTSA